MSSHKIPHEKGDWQVSRNCCTSGNCFACQGATTGKGCIRVVHANNYSERYARYVAANWSDYYATAEPMYANEAALRGRPE